VTSRVRHKAIPTTARRRKDDVCLQSVIGYVLNSELLKTAGYLLGIFFAYRIGRSTTAFRGDSRYQGKPEYVTAVTSECDKNRRRQDVLFRCSV